MRSGHAFGRRARAATAAATALALLGTTTATVASVRPRVVTANVIVAASSSNINNLPVWVAQSKGYFAEEGINAQLQILTASTTTPALIAGSVQFVDSPNSTFLTSRAASLPIVAVDATAYGIPLGMILSNSFISSHGITAKTPMKTIAKDMLGSKGGASGSSTIGAMSVMFNSFGYSISDVTLATFSSVPALEAGFESGQVSWFATGQPVPFQVAALGYGQVLGSSKNIAAWSIPKEGYGNVIVTSNSYAAANPAIVKEFVKAMEMASKYISQHSRQALAIAEANMPGIAGNIIFNSMRTLQYPLNGQMTVNKWRSSIAFNVKSGLLTPGLRVVQNVDWTNRYT